MMPSGEELAMKELIERQLGALGYTAFGEAEYEPPGLGVDWVYTRAEPAFAVEVTSVREEREEAGRARVRKLERRVNASLAASGPPAVDAWHAIIRVTKNLDALEQLLVELILEGREIDAYNSTDREYLKIGLLRLHRVPGPPRVAVSGATEVVKVDADLTRDLQRAVDDKTPPSPAANDTSRSCCASSGCDQRPKPRCGAEPG